MVAIGATGSAGCPPPVRSAYFGEFRRDPASEIRLPSGLPGFEAERALVAIEIPDQRPLVYLQSVSTPDLCFLSLPAGVILPEFEFQFGEEERAALGFAAEERLIPGKNILMLALLFPSDDSLVVNMAAPLLINIQEMTGVQCVLEHPPSQPHRKLDEHGNWVPSC